jgi:hypothetical protein
LGENRKNVSCLKNKMENMSNWLEALPYTKCGLDGGGKHMLGKVLSDYTKTMGAGL